MNRIFVLTLVGAFAGAGFAQEPNVVEVTVLEWPAFRHSATGRAVLDEARKRLREKFGDVAVSRAAETTHSRAS